MGRGKYAQKLPTYQESCLRRHLRLLIKQKSVQCVTMNDSRFLAWPLDVQELKTTIKLTITLNKKAY